MASFVTFVSYNYLSIDSFSRKIVTTTNQHFLFKIPDVSIDTRIFPMREIQILLPRLKAFDDGRVLEFVGSYDTKFQASNRLLGL